MIALGTPDIAEAHDERFSEAPTDNFLQLGLSTFVANLNTNARGEVPQQLASLGAELCFPTHGRLVIDFKPCVHADLLMIPLKDQMSFVFDFARFELDFGDTDAWYFEWGVGVRAQKNRKAKMLGYNADLLIAWRSDSKEKGVGLFVATGVVSTGMVSTKRIPRKLLDADADANLDLDGFEANGDLGAFFPEREAGIWNGLIVKVGYNFPN